jgi:restriction system protein
MFVADIMSHKYGEDFHVTKSSGDFGVDIEHGSGSDKIFGQVKCYKDDLSFDPIALVHSNMIKHGATKGYVVTTSSFTENARLYAQDLDVDLIDGVQLVEMWINYKNPVMETVEAKPYEFTPVIQE